LYTKETSACSFAPGYHYDQVSFLRSPVGMVFTPPGYFFEFRWFSSETLTRRVTSAEPQRKCKRQARFPTRSPSPMPTIPASFPLRRGHIARGPRAKGSKCVHDGVAASLGHPVPIMHYLASTQGYRKRTGTCRRIPLSLGRTLDRRRNSGTSPLVRVGEVALEPLAPFIPSPRAYRTRSTRQTLQLQELRVC